MASPSQVRLFLNKIRPKDHIAEAGAAFSHLAIAGSGNGIQSVYLTEIDAPCRGTHRLDW
jgi:hypothetical protein